MKLTRLDIEQLPGIRPGFTISDLAAGVNMVTGPNAIGKSSLIRALGYLVGEPTPADPAALSLAADFENGGRWTATRTGRALEWRRDGQVAPPPPLPEHAARHCYWLTMENLVQPGEDDAELVERLRQALAGGYNLPALRDGPFALRPRLGGRERSELLQAQRERREVAASYQALQRREQRLPELERRERQARRAGARAERLDKALALLDAIGGCAEAEAALESFPPDMDRLHGNELARLGKLEEARDGLAARIEQTRRRRDDAEARLAQTGLAEARPPETELAARHDTLAAIGHRLELIADRRAGLDQARAEEGLALQALGAGGQPPRLEPAQVSRAEAFARRLKQKQTARDDVAARLDADDAAPAEATIERHGRAVQALLEWLAHSGRAGRRDRRGALLAGIGGLIAIVASLVVRGWLAAGGAALALAGAAWSLLRMRTDPAQQARRDFERLGLQDAPEHWSRAAVTELADALQARLAEMRLARQRALAAAEDRKRLERMDAELAGLEGERETLARELGFQPTLTAAAIDGFVRHVQARERAAARRQALEDEIRRLEGQAAGAIDEVHGFLSRWGVSAEKDHASLAAALSDLEHRAREAAEARDAVAAAGRELERLDQDLAAREREIAELYAEAGLGAGQRRSLEERVDRLEGYRDQRQRLRDRRGTEREHRRALQDARELIERVERGEREALEQERDRAREEAGELEDLIREQSGIRAAAKAAGTDRALERAMAEVDRTRSALADRMHEQLFAEAGQFLLDQVEGEHRAEHEPEVLREARERFRRFTHHAWDVELTGQGLVARDLEQDTARPLDTLSSGTRMQLLLAVRLAWTRRLEQGAVALPLFLDEALTTSDERRFAAVATSLVDLAREEGRQVFYLSARRSELALWEAITGERPHHVDLARVRFGEPGTDADSYAVAAEEPLPEPEGRTPAAYAAKLGVPPVAPARPAGSLHLFHLLRDDLPLLHRLMQDWNVRTLGQAELLLASDVAGKAVPDESARARLAGRCRTARAWTEAWRHGRGRPVDRIALEQSGAVTDKFIDQVTALAESCNGDAERTIERLADRVVSGFGPKKTAELREYLEEQGHISREDSLDAEGRERRTLLDAARDVPAAEIRKVARWLEASATEPAGRGDRTASERTINSAQNQA